MKDYKLSEIERSEITAVCADRGGNCVECPYIDVCFPNRKQSKRESDKPLELYGVEVEE